MRSIYRLTILALALLLLPNTMQADANDPDAKVIAALKREGADLTKPHHIDFFFDFSTEASAKAVCDLLSAEGYRSHLEANDERSRFTCRAVKTMIPELAVIQALTRRFNALATQHGGVYDGWGTEVEK